MGTIEDCGLILELNEGFIDEEIKDLLK